MTYLGVDISSLFFRAKSDEPIALLMHVRVSVRVCVCVWGGGGGVCALCGVQIDMCERKSLQAQHRDYFSINTSGITSALSARCCPSCV